MTTALIMDFAGGTKDHYDEVMRRMGLGDRPPTGAIFHGAGSYRDGWRIIDVWEDMEAFARFRDTQIMPHTQAVGLGAPDVRVIEIAEQKPGSGAKAAFIQCVFLPGLSEADFHSMDARMLAGGLPGSLTFHVNGPHDGGWCVIDAWTSRGERDQFMEERRDVLMSAPISGPPQIEDLTLEASLVAATAAAAGT